MILNSPSNIIQPGSGNHKRTGKLRMLKAAEPVTTIASCKLCEDIRSLNKKSKSSEVNMCLYHSGREKISKEIPWKTEIQPTMERACLMWIGIFNRKCSLKGSLITPECLTCKLHYFQQADQVRGSVCLISLGKHSHCIFRHTYHGSHSS